MLQRWIFGVSANHQASETEITRNPQVSGLMSSVEMPIASIKLANSPVEIASIISCQKKSPSQLLLWKTKKCKPDQ